MQKVYNNPNNPSVFSGLDVRDFPWDRIEGAILRWGRPPPRNGSSDSGRPHRTTTRCNPLTP
ncbi:hypothetical protein MICRO11B_100032 [Micrococcus luteus]|nr:hypothetical protein MICRO11B_100032 [Micrococcus luteus]